MDLSRLTSVALEARKGYQSNFNSDGHALKSEV